MYYLFSYLLALVAAMLGSAENITSVEETNLPIPRIYGISRNYDEGIVIYWILQEKTEDGRILGYKVKLWQVGCVKKPMYNIVNGQRVRRRNGMPRLLDSSTLRNRTEFTLEGIDNTNLLLKDIELDVPYHMTVAAYSAEGEGPSSNPFRFQPRGTYTCREI